MSPRHAHTPRIGADWRHARPGLAFGPGQLVSSRSPRGRRSAVGARGLLRWAYRRGGSLVPPPPAPGRPDEYGLLVSIAAPQTATDAEAAIERLEQAGVRVTLAATSAGPRLMVFADDEATGQTVAVPAALVVRCRGRQVP